MALPHRAGPVDASVSQESTVAVAAAAAYCCATASAVAAAAAEVPAVEAAEAEAQAYSASAIPTCLGSYTLVALVWKVPHGPLSVFGALPSRREASPRRR